MEATTINATQLRVQTRDLIERVRFKGERFIVETFGRPVAVIISFEDFGLIKETLPNSLPAGAAPPGPLTTRSRGPGGHRRRARAKPSPPP